MTACTLAAIALVLCVGLGQVAAGELPARFQMTIESAERGEDGSVTVTTTGARYEIAPDGAVECYQRIPQERKVAHVTITGAALPLTRPRVSGDGYLCTVGLKSASHLEVTADSVLRVAPRADAEVIVELAFEPEYFASEMQNFFAADYLGGCGAYQLPTRPGPALDRIEEQRGGRFHLEPGESLLVSVFPPREYDWEQHEIEHIIHDFPPLLEPGLASRPLPTDEQLREWRSFGNVLVLHLEFWEGFCIPGIKPRDPERFEQVCRLAHELGYRVLIYTSPYFFRAEGGRGRDTSEPEQYLAEMDHLLSYPVDGLYWDGIYSDVEKAWRVARLARQRLGDRRLYVHCTRKPFHESRVICPFVDTYADYLLRGEGRNRRFIHADFVRFIVSGYNVSNAVGTLCYDACRIDRDIVEECLGANAKIPYWPGGQISRMGRKYFLLPDEHALFADECFPRMLEVGSEQAYAPLERANRDLRARLRAERRAARDQHLRELEQYLAERKAAVGPTDNLAAFKPTTASNVSDLPGQGPHQLGWLPEYATDARPKTYWGADYAPQWLMVDLAGEGLIGRIVVVNFADGERYYHYRVECSTDGETWRAVAEKTDKSPATWDGDEHVIEPTLARYVRVVMLHNSANIGLHVGELEVYQAQE